MVGSIMKAKARGNGASNPGKPQRQRHYQEDQTSENRPRPKQNPASAPLRQHHITSGYILPLAKAREEQERKTPFQAERCYTSSKPFDASPNFGRRTFIF